MRVCAVYLPVLPLSNFHTDLHALSVAPTTDLDTGISDLLANATLTAEVLANADLFPLGTDPFDTHSNVTLEVYNTTTRIGTDTFDRCSSEAGALGGVANGIFPSVYAVQWNRSYQDPGYNTYGVCLPLPVPGYPYGNPTEGKSFLFPRCERSQPQSAKGFT